MLRRGAALVVVAGAVQAGAELAAEAADGGPAGAEALGLEQMIGQFLVGPGGAVEALRGRSGAARRTMWMRSRNLGSVTSRKA